MLTKSPAARTALVYVTAGALILIWTAVWSIWMRNHPPESAGLYYVVGGLFATGLIVLLIGLGIGRLGFSARHADNPTILMTPTAVAGPPQAAVVATPPPVVTTAEPSATTTPVLAPGAPTLPNTSPQSQGSAQPIGQR